MTAKPAYRDSNIAINKYTSENITATTNENCHEVLTLLCIDDDKQVLRSLLRLFRAEPFKVLTAETSEDAFALLASEAVHVVMADQRMPDMSGVEFLSQVKINYPDTVRLVLSGYSDVNSILASINRGEVYRFLGKPWQDDELKTTLQQCFEHYQLLSENRNLFAELKEKNNTLKVLNRKLKHDVEVHSYSANFRHSMIENIPLTIIGTDTNLNIVIANQCARNTLGISEDSRLKDFFSETIAISVKDYIEKENIEPSTVYCEKTDVTLSLSPINLNEHQQHGCLLVISDKH